MKRVITLPPIGQLPRVERTERNIDDVVESMWKDYATNDICMALIRKFGGGISRSQPFASWQRIRRRHMKALSDSARKFTVSLCGDCDCVHLTIFDKKERVITEVALPDKAWDRIFMEVAIQQRLRDQLVKPS